MDELTCQQLQAQRVPWLHTSAVPLQPVCPPVISPLPPPARQHRPLRLTSINTQLMTWPHYTISNTLGNCPAPAQGKPTVMQGVVEGMGCSVAFEFLSGAHHIFYDEQHSKGAIRLD